MQEHGLFNIPRQIRPAPVLNDIQQEVHERFEENSQQSARAMAINMGIDFSA